MSRVKIDFKDGFPVKLYRCEMCDDDDGELPRLENDERDNRVLSDSFRVCRDGNDACCREFWDHHKNHFVTGLLAQRLGHIRWME